MLPYEELLMAVENIIKDKVHDIVGTEGEEH